MVIRQGSKNDDESGIHSDDFIIESADSDFLDRPNAEYLDGDSKLPGQLVRKILETKNQLEKEVVKSSQSTTLAWSDHVFESQERRKIQEEISNMQELLQSLARTAHPLAKTLEFLGEDSEQMLKECLQWRQEYKRNRLLLDQKRKQIDADLQALRNQSRVLEEEIEEKKKSILAMKRSTFMNEQKITKILHGVCSS
ncbi:unnamed protein product [Soboliphyme baturini]|uniref:MIP-T3_C domain-containing protein n=1 Tax=Soboliphyme baturini TaxID=241478 RepID=A0A183J5X5_9BILA|nr:unnamed protein product [Soboliphyme baturini]